MQILVFEVQVEIFLEFPPTRSRGCLNLDKKFLRQNQNLKRDLPLHYIMQVVNSLISGFCFLAIKSLLEFFKLFFGQIFFYFFNLLNKSFLGNFLCSLFNQYFKLFGRKCSKVIFGVYN